MIKLWLDDIRYPPDETWVWTKTPEEVIDILSSTTVSELSLDHDLGLDDYRTGYTVLQWIEERITSQEYINFSIPILTIHSANPVGRKRMQAAIDQINKLKNETT